MTLTLGGRRGGGGYPNPGNSLKLGVHGFTGASLSEHDQLTVLLNSVFTAPSQRSDWCHRSRPRGPLLSLRKRWGFESYLPEIKDKSQISLDKAMFFTTYLFLLSVLFWTFQSIQLWRYRLKYPLLKKIINYSYMTSFSTLKP